MDAQGPAPISVEPSILLVTTAFKFLAIELTRGSVLKMSETAPLRVVVSYGEATNPKRKRGRARRLFLKKAVDLARKYETENLEMLEKALASPEFEERLKTSLQPPAASRESAESTPDPSP